jgi:hypothetical protein
LQTEPEIVNVKGAQRWISGLLKRLKIWAQVYKTVAEFIDTDWGDKVRVVVQARLVTWAGGPVQQPYAGVDHLPVLDL